VFQVSSAVRLVSSRRRNALKTAQYPKSATTNRGESADQRQQSRIESRPSSAHPLWEGTTRRYTTLAFGLLVLLLLSHSNRFLLDQFGRTPKKSYCSFFASSSCRQFPSQRTRGHNRFDGVLPSSRFKVSATLTAFVRPDIRPATRHESASGFLRFRPFTAKKLLQCAAWPSSRIINH